MPIASFRISMIHRPTSSSVVPPSFLITNLVVLTMGDKNTEMEERIILYKHIRKKWCLVVVGACL